MSLASRLNERLPADWQEVDTPESIQPRHQSRCAKLMIGHVPLFVGERDPSATGSDWWFCCPFANGMNWHFWDTLLRELPHVVASIALSRVKWTPPAPIPAIPSWAKPALDKQREARLELINNRVAWANRLADTLGEERRVLEMTP